MRTRLLKQLVMALSSSALMSFAGQLDFTSLSETDARQMASKIDFGQETREFCEASLASGRYELVDLCWEYHYTSVGMGEIMRAMPLESKTRDALVVMFFRNQKRRWPSYMDTDMIFGADGLIAKQRAETVVPLLHKYLPDLPIDFRVIDTPEKRLALSKRYAEAAGILIEEPGLGRRVWPPKLKDGTAMVRDSGHSTKSGVSASALPGGKPEVAKTAPGSWALWAGIAATFATAAGWLLLRRKDRGGKV